MHGSVRYFHCAHAVDNVSMLPSCACLLLLRTTALGSVGYTCSMRSVAASREPNCRYAASMAPLAFSPRYAAPEVLRAFEGKQIEMKVAPSIDIWSLGVMAYELLTDKPVFDKCAAMRLLCSCVSGPSVPALCSTLGKTSP